MSSAWQAAAAGVWLALISCALVWAWRSAPAPGRVAVSPTVCAASAALSFRLFVWPRLNVEGALQGALGLWMTLVGVGVVATLMWPILAKRARST